MALGEPGRAAKGKRPAFHDSPATDQLIAMVIALTSELATTRRRLAVIERVAEASGAFTREAIERYVPTPADQGADEAERLRLLRSLFYLMNKEIADLAEGSTEAGFDAAINRIRDDI
jgi:hypothetical protein